MPITGVGAAEATAGGDEYVSRGDAPDWDWEVGDITADSAFHELDLSSIVTDSDAFRVEFRLVLKDNLVGSYFTMRKKGFTVGASRTDDRTLVANAYHGSLPWVECSTSQIIEYSCTTGTDEMYLVILGWWKPAS